MVPFFLLLKLSGKLEKRIVSLCVRVCQSFSYNVCIHKVIWLLLYFVHKIDWVNVMNKVSILLSYIYTHIYIYILYRSNYLKILLFCTLIVQWIMLRYYNCFLLFYQCVTSVKVSELNPFYNGENFETILKFLRF